MTLTSPPSQRSSLITSVTAEAVTRRASRKTVIIINKPHTCLRHVNATVNNTALLSKHSIKNNNTQHNLATDHEEATDMDYSTTHDGSAQFSFTNVDGAVMQHVATWEVDLAKKAPLL